MKTVNGKLGLILRLGILAGVMLFTQQALAAGTTADTPVLNRATVVYTVGTVLQTGIESSPTGNDVPGALAGEDTEFRVDRRVDFQIDQQLVAAQPVTPGQTGGPPGNAFIEFLLVNDSNDALDFDLSALNTVGVDTGRGEIDNVDVTVVGVAVSPNSELTGGGNPVFGGPAFVDSLPADDSIRIRVFADIVDPTPGPIVDGDISVIELSATAHTAGSGAADALVETVGAGLPLVVENVFVNGPVGGFAVETQVEGFLAQSSDLTITKTSRVIWDPVNTGNGDDKAIPGARIEYIVTAVNDALATSTAVGLVLTDAINAEVTFRADHYGADQDVAYEVYVGAPPVALANFCDANPGDATICQLAGVNLTVGGTGLVLDVAPGETLEIRFVVELPPVP